MRRAALFLAMLGLAAFRATPLLAAPCPLAPPVTSSGPNYPPDAPAPPMQLTTITRDDQTGYCLYTPPGAVRGLVLYVHGFQLVEHGGLDPMLQYIANAGYYVVYPYDNPVVTPTAAKSALAAALAYLQQKGVTMQNLAVAGYSAGGMAAEHQDG
jgi:dipeptidyl aminopeptidase/acylaminoacyl peptidase